MERVCLEQEKEKQRSEFAKVQYNETTTDEESQMAMTFFLAA
jgi:hypothetical protein